MRWLIGLVIVAVLTVIAWFWYPRLMATDTISPSSMIPADAWGVFPIDDPSDRLVLTDSLSPFRYVLEPEMIAVLNNLPDKVQAWLYLYGDQGTKAWGILSPTTLSDSSIASILPDHVSFEGFERYQSQVSTEVLGNENPFVKQLTETITDATAMYIRPQTLLSQNLFATRLPLNRLLAANFEGDDWMTLEVNGETGLFRLMGVEQRSNDASGTAVEGSNTNLINYLPAQIGAAIITQEDSMALATVYCPYQLDDTTTDQNIFIFTERLGQAVDTLEEAQTYQSVPIAIRDLGEIPFQVKPQWAGEAYVAQLSSHVLVYGVSFEAIVRVIDDFLADDRLISSPYYKPLEPYVSSGSFTLYLRPDVLRLSENPVFGTQMNDAVNTVIYQTFEELPGQQFHTLGMIHGREIKDLAPVKWSVRLDTLIAAGPWPFKNHYNQEPEVLVQDASNQLYLINKDGRVLWKRTFDGLINGAIESIDGFSNNKLQLVFTTSTGLHFVDRNGNEVDGFPIKLKDCTAAPLCVRYNKKGDYRFIAQNGDELINFSPDGKPVKGWRKADISNGLNQPVHYLRYSGKDYLLALDGTNKVHILDRAGKKRTNGFAIDSNVFDITLVRGTSFSACRMIGHDTLGDLYSYDLSGKKNVENLLPLGGDVGLMTVDPSQYRYITHKGDRVIALDKERNVSLDYLLPEPLAPRMYPLDEYATWIGMENRKRTAFYLLDLEGRLLDKMPLEGKGPAILLDLDQNGSMECILPSSHQELVAYKLAD